MHKVLREALGNATGDSRFLFAVIADIRDFSTFSIRHDPPEVAMYIKKVYIKLIEEYFQFASFYKSTGDGLLIAIEFDQGNLQNLQDQAQNTVDACLRCVEKFAAFCDDDLMINYDVPSRIGFGVTRGTACCLMSGETVLDYSGHILNLASRLCDLARPEGIILDRDFGVELLEGPIQEKFEQDRVYIRSVAEEEPRNIYIQGGVVEIPPEAKLPVRFEKWEEVTDVYTLAEWLKRGPRWLVELPQRLKRPDGLRVMGNTALYKGGKRVPNVTSEYEITEVQYLPIGNTPRVIVNLEKFVARLRASKVPLREGVTLTVQFVPRIE